MSNRQAVVKHLKISTTMYFQKYRTQHKEKNETFYFVKDDFFLEYTHNSLTRLKKHIGHLKVVYNTYKVFKRDKFK